MQALPGAAMKSQRSASLRSTSRGTRQRARSILRDCDVAVRRTVRLPERYLAVTRSFGLPQLRRIEAAAGLIRILTVAGRAPTRGRAVAAPAAVHLDQGCFAWRTRRTGVALLDRRPERLTARRAWPPATSDCRVGNLTFTRAPPAGDAGADAGPRSISARVRASTAPAAVVSGRSATRDRLKGSRSSLRRSRGWRRKGW
jgi:hypothetical protein